MDAGRTKAADAGGYSVMADMTYPEMARVAKDGVIEQHGPRLPLATAVYIPSAILRIARRALAAKGISTVIAPPFYWGVDHLLELEGNAVAEAVSAALGVTMRKAP